MKIGNETIPRTGISTSDETSITVRGKDLCSELIGKISFTDYFLLLLTGQMPSPELTAVADATLVAIAEHGLVPSVQASRMTYAASPEALQSAVAAGILGCGSVILGAAEEAGVLLHRVVEHSINSNLTIESSAKEVLAQYKASGKKLPGYGHPLHKTGDPRVHALFDVAANLKMDYRYIEAAEIIETLVPDFYKKPLRLNVSAAIPAVLLGAGFPVNALKGIPILARTGGLLAHLHEEAAKPIGFALSYQASRAAVYDEAESEAD